MAEDKLVECDVCEKKVAESAVTCPHCGALRRRSYLVEPIVIGIVVVGLLGSLLWVVVMAGFVGGL